ncbi:MAG: hypothetical protein ACYC3S_00085 [Chloroflexota bacterium]
MFARVSHYLGSKDRIEEVARFLRDDRTVSQQRGFKKAYFFADRATGRALTITLWDSEESMRAAGQPAGSTRSRINEKLGGSEQPMVEEFELLNESDPQPRTNLLR